MNSEILETHLEETKQIVIDHVNQNLKPIEESGKGRLKLLSERLGNISQNTKFLELANERLKLFEEKINNLGFPVDEAEAIVNVYKQKLVKFLGSGLKEYLLRQK